VIIFEHEGGGALAGVDPRWRLGAVLSLAVVLYAAPSLAGPAAALGVAAGVAVLARVPPGRTLRRLAALNLFMAVVLVTIPLGVPGEPLWDLGGLAWSREGVARAGRIALQANAVMLAAFALLATLDPVRLGVALRGLGAPRQVVVLFFLLVRYIEVIHQEYHRLSDALALRCFRPRASRHTLKAFGYLVGQLLLRSLERADRILAAMRCRGFDGRFHLLAASVPGRGNLVFALGWAAALLVVGWLGWRANL